MGMGRRWGEGSDEGQPSGKPTEGAGGEVEKGSHGWESTACQGPVLGPGPGAHSLICRIVQLFPSQEVVSGWRGPGVAWRGVNGAGWSFHWGRGPWVHSHDQLPFRLPWSCVGKGFGSAGDRVCLCVCVCVCVCVCFHFCLTALLGFSHRTKPFERQSTVYIPTGLCLGRGVRTCPSA